MRLAIESSGAERAAAFVDGELAYRAAIELAPPRCTLHRQNLYRYLISQERYDEAVSETRAALLLHPTDKDLLEILARAMRGPDE